MPLADTMTWARKRDWKMIWLRHAWRDFSVMGTSMLLLGRLRMKSNCLLMIYVLISCVLELVEPWADGGSKPRIAQIWGLMIIYSHTWIQKNDSPWARRKKSTVTLTCSLRIRFSALKEYGWQMLQSVDCVVKDSHPHCSSFTQLYHTAAHLPSELD